MYIVLQNLLNFSLSVGEESLGPKETCGFHLDDSAYKHAHLLEANGYAKVLSASFDDPETPLKVNSEVSIESVIVDMPGNTGAEMGGSSDQELPSTTTTVDSGQADSGSLGQTSPEGAATSNPEASDSVNKQFEVTLTSAKKSGRSKKQ